MKKIRPLVPRQQIPADQQQQQQQSVPTIMPGLPPLLDTNAWLALLKQMEVLNGRQQAIDLQKYYLSALEQLNGAPISPQSVADDKPVVVAVKRKRETPRKRNLISADDSVMMISPKTVVRRKLKIKNLKLSDLSYAITDCRAPLKAIDPDHYRRLLSKCAMDLENDSSQKQFKLRRLKHKLENKLAPVSRRQRFFDLDKWISEHLRSNPSLRLLNDSTITHDKDTKWRGLEYDLGLDLGVSIKSKKSGKHQVTSIPKSATFYQRLMGSTDRGLKFEKPLHLKIPEFIHRDLYTRSPHMKLMDAIRKTHNQELPSSIDYTYFYPSHLEQAEDLLRRNLWPSISLTSELETPLQGLIASYGRQVVGALFFDTNPGCSTVYLTYCAVKSGWSSSGIARKLLYIAINGISNKKLPHMDIVLRKDWVLHVMPTNIAAMILYSQMGFKSEAYVIGFYNGYVYWKDGAAGLDCVSTKARRNAVYMRLRQ